MATIKQQIVRFLYPLIRRIGKKGKNGTVLSNTQQVAPNEPLNVEKIILNTGKEFTSSALSGKKLLIVNTASNCGYTGQYAELQSLFERAGDKVSIIAFPANDFLEQEKASDKDIAQFCQVNYGVTFPIAKKAVVIKNADQHPVFKWLTNSSANGWNSHAPDWNFSKYLIDEKGNLTNYFGPSISPLDDVVLKAINNS